MGVAAAHLLPSLLSLLLVIAAAGAAGAEYAIIRPAAAGAGNKELGETLCCSNMTGYHECVQACFAFYPPEDAAKYCDPGCKEAYVCHSVSGDECLSEHHSSLDSVTTDSADAEKFCDPGCKEAYQCHTVSGDECPSGQRSSSHDSSANGNAVDRCILGCNSSVCNKMVTGVGRKGVVKHAVERCNNACYNFCTKGVRTGTSAA